MARKHNLPPGDDNHNQEGPGPDGEGGENAGHDQESADADGLDFDPARLEAESPSPPSG